jgi:catechol 2,3-dioxygenase-like lactoylglutathione lyase family enzyme
MKRFHVHVAVNNLTESTQFYAALFGAPPSVVKPDYAKWMLEDPRLNFAISQRAEKAGINHLGFQAETDAELDEIHTRVRSANTAITSEEAANCCYAISNKHWVEDPSGIAWESFRSLETIPFHSEPSQRAAAKENSSSASSTTCCPIPIAIEQPAKACCHV